MNPQEAFLELLIAAMLDAATQMKLTQLQTTITPDGHKRPKVIRLIVVPEVMEYKLGTPSQPLGSDPRNS